MKKWIFLFLIIIAIGIWQMFSLYENIYANINNKMNQAAMLAMTETPLQTFTNKKYYHGKKTYYIISGETDGKEKVYVFVPGNLNEENIIVIEQNKGLTKDEVRENVIEERGPLTIKSIRLGMENEKPLWEIVYIDKEKRYTYYYVDFESGKFLKRYSLKIKEE